MRGKVIEQYEGGIIPTLVQADLRWKPAPILLKIYLTEEVTINLNTTQAKILAESLAEAVSYIDQTVAPKES